MKVNRKRKGCSFILTVLLTAFLASGVKAPAPGSAADSVTSVPVYTAGGGREYTLSNASFEAFPGGWPAGWSHSGGGTAAPSDDAYYGAKSMQLTNPSGGFSSLWQSIPVGPGDSVPHIGDGVEAGLWINIPASVELGRGQFYLQIASEDRSGVQTLLAKSGDLTRVPRDQWFWLKTDGIAGKGSIPGNAVKLIFSLQNNLIGSVYVDFVQAATRDVMTGNPGKFAIAQYQPWFGNAPNWSHWGYADARVHHDPATILPNGRRDIAAHFYPRIGAYDSTDINVLRDQRDVAKAMLIDDFSVDYYGDLNPAYKHALELMLKVADENDFKVSIMYEPKVHMLNWIPHKTRQEKIEAIVRDIKTIVDRYGSHKSLLKYRGRVVVSFFGANNNGLTSADWDAITKELHQSGYDPFLMIDRIPTTFDSSYMAAADSAFNWRIYSPDIQGGTQNLAEGMSSRTNQGTADWVNAGPADRLGVGIVWPGFDDSGVDGWGAGERVVNHDGTTHFYEGSWEGMASKGLDWVLIATFNDWNESTAIEPSMDFGYSRSIVTQNRLEAFKGVAPVDDGKMQQVTEDYLNRTGIPHYR